MKHIRELDITEFATFCLHKLLPMAVYKAQIIGTDNAAILTAQMALSKEIKAIVSEIIDIDAPGDENGRMICQSRFALIKYRPETPIEGLATLQIKIDEEIELKPIGEFINVRTAAPEVEFHARHETNRDELVPVELTAEIITAWRAEMEKVIDSENIQIFDLFHGMPNAGIPDHS